MLKNIIITLSSILITLIISKVMLIDDNVQIITFDEDKIYYDIVTYISTNLDKEGELTEDEFDTKSSKIKIAIIQDFYKKIKEIAKERNIIFLKKDFVISNHQDQTEQVRDILYQVININHNLL